jgi:hypothetical protein
MNMSIPKYCRNLVKNQYHNGHPDLIPINTFLENAVQYSSEGIEVKGSRHLNGWQGHNPEAVWLMVFCFDSNTSSDSIKNVEPKPSGRSSTSRRTITASVNKNGFRKMKTNWVYEDPSHL